MVEFFDKMSELTEETEHEESDPENTDDEENANEAYNPFCVLCVMNQKTTLLEPCNHLKFCQECVDTLINTQIFDDGGNQVKPKCPDCDTIITGHKIVYL